MASSWPLMACLIASLIRYDPWNNELSERIEAATAALEAIRAM